MGVQVIKYSYARLGRRWRRPARGFRLSPARRLSVRGLRAKLWTLLGLMGRCARNVRLLTRGLVVAAGGSSSSTTTTSTGGGGVVGGRRSLVDGGVGRAGGGKGGTPVAMAQAAPAGGNNGKPRRPPCMRSNSFYARAVAECLDFIKGSNAAAPIEDNRGGAAAGGACHGTAKPQAVLKAS